MVEKTMLGLIRDQETPSEQLDLEYATLQHTTFPLLKSDPEPCRCAACGEQILERYYLLAVDKQWHVSCLKCSQCHLSLDSQLTCFEKDGQIYCKEDYYRRFAVKQCSRCHEGITANELVMKARHLVFHLGCFTCASCNKVLTTGDHFGISGDTVFCRQHYQLALRTDLRVADMSPTDMSPVSNMSSGADLSLGYGPGSQPNAAPLPFYNGTGAVQKGRPRKRSHQSTELDRCDQLVGAIQNEADMAYSQDGYVQMARQKRMRTSFKHHQLRTMKSYFSLNHNPDAKDLKQLAQKTGLSKRILQVWFQNARAKYRRNQLKQQDRGGGGGSACPEDGATCPTQDGGSFTLDDSCSNSSSKLTAAEASSGAHSPAASDLSSSPSVSVLRGNTSESESLPSGSALAGLFSSLHSGL